MRDLKIFVDLERVINIGVVDEIFLVDGCMWFFEVGLYDDIEFVFK